MKNANQVLAGFSGTEHWYKYPLPGCTFTDGVQFMAKEYGAYWLIDLVFSYQCKPAVRKEFFQVWELTRISGDSFNVTGGDGDGIEIVKQYIPFSDFPFDKVKLYLSHGCLMLPSEY